jgi:hypothetical protein
VNCKDDLQLALQSLLSRLMRRRVLREEMWNRERGKQGQGDRQRQRERGRER